MTSLYREIDALGGVGNGDYHQGCTPTRAELIATANAHFDLVKPASADRRGDFARAYVAIAGWKTPACPSTVRTTFPGDYRRPSPVLKDRQHGSR